MKELLNVRAMVKDILIQDEQARNSDSYLYMKVLEKIAKNWEVPLYGMTVCYFLRNMKSIGAPPFETVRRSRQILQAKYPKLAACKNVATARAENEKVYYEFSQMEA